MTRVLFVCLGNICRSPSAEAVLRRTAPAGTRIDSAGTENWHSGKPPYAPMQAAAKARGLDMSGLRARQVSVEDFTRFDLIVAMDRQNMADLRLIEPDGATARLALLTDFADVGVRDVPDPYYTRDFDGCFDLIETACRGLNTQLAGS